MNLFAFILLMLCAVSNIVAFAMLFSEKQRNNQRYRAMLDYVSRCAEDVSDECEKLLYETKDDISTKVSMEMREHKDAVRESMATQDAAMREKIEALMLDYSQAQEAASRINDFGASLASIFDYDPMKALQKGRQKEAS